MRLFGKGKDDHETVTVGRRYGVVHITKHASGGASGGVEWTGADSVSASVTEPARGRKPRRG